MCAEFRWPGGAQARHRHQLVGSGTPAQVKVETMFRELGWKIMWTPPYAPKNQPNELVLSADKQSTGILYMKGHTLRVV